MMKNKRDIYCDYNFWEAFFEKEEQILHNRPMRKLWDAFYDFLSSNNVYFNVSKDDINEDSKGGKNLMEIIRKKGGAGIRFISTTFPHINKMSDVDDNLLNSVFLTTLATSECEALSRDFGVIVFNMLMIFSAKHVYVDNGIALYQANGQNWKFLMELNACYPTICCCNSLVIADRYLLYNQNDNSTETNLKPIFDAFLPQHLKNNIFFTICVIAEYNNEKCSSIEEKLQKFKRLIETMRPNLKFKLNIFHSWLHDRSILTNNVILTSGAGFDVIGTNDVPLKFTTTSLCFPFLQKNSDNNSIYLDWINNVLKKERKCRSYQENYWGEKITRHHLLDYYDEKPNETTNKHRGVFSSIHLLGAAADVPVQSKTKLVNGVFHKGVSGGKDMVIQQQNGYKQQIRTIRNGELLSDGDEVEYVLRCEPNLKNPTKKFWFADDVHVKEKNSSE